jgi:general secretion pathway protein F
MMSPGPNLEDLIALNQEMAAMVRAGIPLELGLKNAGTSPSSRFSALAERISARLSQGDSLVEALRKEGSVVSPAYAAVVEAGLAAGRLPEALEELAGLGLTMQEIRRRVWLAVTYPLMVCCLAYVLFTAFIAFGVPLWISTREALSLPPNRFFDLLAALHHTVRWWGPGIPLALLLAASVPILRMVAGRRSPIDGASHLPGISTVYRHLRRAQFARLLAVLWEREIPAPRAVLLAADSTGDVRLSRSALDVSEQLQRGVTWEEAVSSAVGWPPFLRWMMAAGQREGAFSSVLRQAADVYQRRAERWLDWFRGTLPVALIVGVCSLVVLIYGLSLFVPLQQFWLDLTRAYP